MPKLDWNFDRHNSVAVMSCAGALANVKGNSMEVFLVWIIIGAIAGWLAGLIVKGYGFGLIGNIVVGILGAMLGGWLFGTAGIMPNAGIGGSIVAATLGAVILLLIIRLVRQVA